MSLHISSTCAHRQEAKIVLYNKFYYYVFILIELCFSNFSYFSNFRPFTCFSVMIPEAV